MHRGNSEHVVTERKFRISTGDNGHKFTCRVELVDAGQFHEVRVYGTHGQLRNYGSMPARAHAYFDRVCRDIERDRYELYRGEKGLTVVPEH